MGALQCRAGICAEGAAGLRTEVTADRKSLEHWAFERVSKQPKKFVRTKAATRTVALRGSRLLGGTSAV